MSQRIDLDAMTRPAPRKAVDADWSPRRKKITAIAAVVGGVAALGFGGWKAWSMTAPSLPSSARQAVAVINSSRFNNLDEVRKDQYLQEAGRLMREMTPEERRASREDPAFQKAMARIREERMDENAIRIARGQQPEGFGFGGGDRPQPTEEQRKEWDRMRKEMEEREAKMTEEEKAAERARREAEMRQRIDQQLSSSINTGNAQSMGLRSEMFQKMRRQGFGRGGGPGGGRPGGGGPRGGGGGR